MESKHKPNARPGLAGRRQHRRPSAMAWIASLALHAGAGAAFLSTVVIEQPPASVESGREYCVEVRALPRSETLMELNLPAPTPPPAALPQIAELPPEKMDVPTPRLPEVAAEQPPVAEHAPPAEAVWRPRSPMVQATVRLPRAEAAPAVDAPDEPPAPDDVVCEAPSCVVNPPPVYPPLARRLGRKGLVILRVRVARNGACTAVEIMQSSGHAVLDDAAVKAVKSWTFKAGSIGGMAVDAELEIPIRFKLVE